MKISEEDYLAHYGILRRSGRYPWGSGSNPYQRSISFLDEINRLKKEEGLTEPEIARGFGMTSTQLRDLKTIARAEKKAAEVAQAQRLKEKGLSNIAIGEKMGVGESSVRALLKAGEKYEQDVLKSTSEMLKKEVAKKTLVDVGAGVELNPRIGISRTKLNAALTRLKDEGYEVHRVKFEQAGTGHMTEYKVLAPPGWTQKDVWKNRYDIQSIEHYSDDGGRSFLGLEPPKSLSSKRIKVNYDEDGGSDADGVIYLRPGVDDLSLGKSNYAQVRIAVDGTHFLKGMAMYKHDMPKGVDVIFNTNKSKKDVASDLDAMKPMKTKSKDDPSIDWDNPFGAVIQPGGQRGVLNIVNEEGNWSEWSRTLSSQFLSKQSPKLADTQLKVLREQKKADLDEILSLTNPAVKRKLLEAFADDADASAVNLEAAALSRRQAHHVILPLSKIKPTEVYAPNFNDGERVVLIRHPHGGIFEIPELVVNNKHSEGRKVLGTQARDAIGINAKVAERLSGADFDGDTVIVIPNNKGLVKTAPALAGLKNFDPKKAYPAYDGMKPMTPTAKQHEMGDVSNLITDMTIKRASAAEIARAVRHSMVVIDAEKHNLNYKQSAIDNGIRELKEKYQEGRGARRGASTIVSRATSEKRVPERKQGYRIDPKTGKKIYLETGRTYVNKNGKVVPKTTKSTKLAEVDDAFKLSSGTTIENIYADHSNQLKAMANQARRELVSTKNTPYSPSARKVYSKEVETLNAKLAIAQRNAPRERQAQVIANSVYTQKKRANPDMTPEEQKKIKHQALAEARLRTGANKERVTITPNEWEAIQAGAITNNKLSDILKNADLDQVRQLATPRQPAKMTSAKQRRAEQMSKLGYTQAEIASALGVAPSTISLTLSGEGG